MLGASINADINTVPAGMLTAQRRGSSWQPRLRTSPQKSTAPAALRAERIVALIIERQNAP